MSAPDAAASPRLTRNRYFGGRLMLSQPERGFRAGDDALFLAAAVPAEAGDRLFEAGVGGGAAALALLARVQGTHVTGVEIDPEAAALARDNARANGFSQRLAVIEADIAAATVAMLAARGVAPGFDHAFANPPFFDEGRVRPAATPSARAARAAPDGALDLWIARLADLVKGGGTVTVIHRAGALGSLLAAFSGRLGGVAIQPLAPREGADAARVLVQGRKGARAEPRLLAPLVLHPACSHAYAPAAAAVLEGGAALDLAQGQHR